MIFLISFAVFIFTGFILFGILGLVFLPVIVGFFVVFSILFALVFGSFILVFQAIFWLVVVLGAMKLGIYIFEKSN